MSNSEDGILDVVVEEEGGREHKYDMAKLKMLRDSARFIRNVEKTYLYLSGRHSGDQSNRNKKNGEPRRTNADHRTHTDKNPVRASAAVAKQVRGWSFKFDGSSKPLEFLEQVEWSAETYGLDPRAIPELLQGTALMWYIANNEHWRTWTSFIVTRRKKGIDEPFTMYMVEMQTLMRPLRFSKEREKEQIYNCSIPDFRAFARP
ncbi:hypothetical protein ACLKA7_007807 [Drosophila subpalustris]